MKLLKCILIFTVVCLGIACDKDIEPEPKRSHEENLVGIWRATKLTGRQTITSNFEDTTVITEQLSEGVNLNWRFNFTKDPKEVHIVGRFDLDVITITNGDTTKLGRLPMEESLDIKGTWDIDGDNIHVVTEEEELTEIRILELNATTFKMKITKVSTDNEYVLKPEVHFVRE